ncbi:MAG: AEC family transporter [Fibrobacterota bacterium]
MFVDKIFEIARITVPVFAITLIGVLLQKKQLLPQDGKKTMSWITYNIALPALIFNSFMKTDSTELFTLPLFAAAVLPIAVAGGIAWILGSISNESPSKKGALTYCSYWGNNGYMGFPLAVNAVGQTTGLATAAVINAMTVPLYIMTGLYLMYRSRSKEAHGGINMKKEALKTFFNPVIITIFASALISWIRAQFPDTLSGLPQMLTEGGAILVETAGLLGKMGLPLALILVGSNLRISEISQDKKALAIALTGKLFIAPLTVFLSVKYIFTGLSQDTFLILILLNAVPGAVASFIIAERLNMEQEFVSTSLVISTALSIITIPLWLYIVM